MSANIEAFDCLVDQNLIIYLLHCVLYQLGEALDVRVNFTCGPSYNIRHPYNRMHQMNKFEVVGAHSICFLTNREQTAAMFDSSNMPVLLCKYNYECTSMKPKANYMVWNENERSAFERHEDCARFLGGSDSKSTNCTDPNNLCLLYGCGAHLDEICETDEECLKHVNHSTCTSQRCVCKDDYFKIDNITCVKKRLSFERCKENYECRTGQCWMEFCGCMPHMYNEDNICKIGIDVDINDKCRSSETCEMGECIGNVCQCLPGFYQTKGGCEKKLKNDQFCEDSNMCESGTCIENECLCDNLSYIETIIRLCVKRRYFGQSCNIHNHCLSNICSRGCKCPLNFYVRNGVCWRRSPFRAICGDNSECISGRCHDNTCQCNEYFRRENNTCVPRQQIMKPCKFNSDCFTGYCKHGECNCPYGFRTLLNYCARDGLYNTDCMRDLNCEYMKCMNKRCQCYKNYQYDDNDHVCVPNNYHHLKNITVFNYMS